MYRKSTMQLIALLFYVAIISYMIGSCFEFTVWANDIRLFTAIMKNVSYVLMVPCILDAVQWTLNNFNKKMIKYLLMLGVFLIYMIFFHVNAAFVCFGFFNGICWINYKYTSAVALALDGIFTGRISTTTRFIRYVCGGSISLFPTVVEDNFDLSVAALKSFALDSSYAQMLFWYGILFSIIVLILLEKFMSVAIKKDNVKLIAILSAVALNGMLQPTVLSLIYNPTIILAIGMIFNSFIERERQNGNN